MQSTVCTLVVLVKYSNLHLYHVFPPGEKLYYTCLCVYINLIKCYKFVVKWFANRKQTEKKIEQQKIWFFFKNICSSGIHKDITQCKKKHLRPSYCLHTGVWGIFQEWWCYFLENWLVKGQWFHICWSVFCELNLLQSRLSLQNSLVSSIV